MTASPYKQNYSGLRAYAHVRQYNCRTTMPTYLYFGEDKFFLTRAINQLKTHTLDQQWVNFNYTEYPPESKETIPQALSDIMTPPVGSGGRLVHLPNSTLLGVCSKEIFLQLESILPKITSTNTLLITNTHKPDARNKSVKLVLEYAQVIRISSH